jgi:hypothetical protein
MQRDSSIKQATITARALYQLRKLDGSNHLVLKNYFSVRDLVRIFGKYAKRFGRENVFYGKYFWYLFWN